ncbi:MAG: enoyl-CoA hydratase [Cohaesibacter sp.]|nr:enoyl-CoA hydratase [Cohaesibacter sp.]MCV6602367.1 enoyl-CoA hydratase [Cohaesibacter sp.]
MPNTQNPNGLTDKILIEQEGKIGRLVINNPTKRNAMSLDMWRAIPNAIAKLDKNPDIHLIVITGAKDTAFVSGADISEFDQVRGDTKSATFYDDMNAKAYHAIRKTKKPTLALIKGFCMGGGFGLAAACDLRLSNASGKFGIPAGKLGIGYPTEAIADIVHLVGPANAKELYLTAKVYDAQQAKRIGFLNDLFADESFDQQASDYCQKIATLAPLSAQYHKASINCVTEQSDERTMQELKAMASACFDSKDYAEGRKAFMEKRKPIFTGH